MLSISLAASADYYTKTAQEEYLSVGGSSRSEWLGKGAEELGLNDTMDREAFLNLYSGFSPDGTRPLVQNAGREDRQPGSDLTFSAPKSFSALWAVASEPSKENLMCAHRGAVKEAFEKLEQEFAFTRRGHLGARTESVSLVGRTFEHATSRAADPQIHTHVFVFNVGLRADGTTGTILNKPFFDAKLELGKFYRDALARHLNRDLGLTMIEHEIAGVPKSLCDAFSTRRHEIEMEMEKTGDTSAKAAERAALATRKPKVPNSRDELFASWKTTALEHGFGQDQAEQLLRSPSRVTKPAHRAHTKEVHSPVQATIGPESISNPVLTARDLYEALKIMAKLAPEKSKANSIESRDQFRTTALEAAKKSRFYGKVLFRIPGTRYEVRLLRDRPFWKAPSWSPLKKLLLPRLGIQRENVPYWQKRRILSNPYKWWGAGPLRLEARKLVLFPKAPHWSPVKQLRASVLTFGIVRPQRPDTDQLSKIRRRLMEENPPPPPPPPRPNDLSLTR